MNVYFSKHAQQRFDQRANHLMPRNRKLALRYLSAAAWWKWKLAGEPAELKCMVRGIPLRMAYDRRRLCVVTITPPARPKGKSLDWKTRRRLHELREQLLATS